MAGGHCKTRLCRVTSSWNSHSSFKNLSSRIELENLSEGNTLLKNELGRIQQEPEASERTEAAQRQGPAQWSHPNHPSQTRFAHRRRSSEGVTVETGTCSQISHIPGTVSRERCCPPTLLDGHRTAQASYRNTAQRAPGSEEASCIPVGQEGLPQPSWAVESVSSCPDSGFSCASVQGSVLVCGFQSVSQGSRAGA